ncbi:transcription termination factor NusA [Orenia marismortui]|uniref:Transcription termination/antitermination protein NusA n=1 Tax=Orenia marismortui TaxID=46469 RepID=A0A4R8GZA7_9FIRM|nr:transcription termination factor NusA [Orenia marismortui]TDX51883.1 NusA antitermination factor [Orenia marismortui]
MNIELIQALEDIEKDKGIPKKMLLDAIEAALKSAYKRDFGAAGNVEVEIDESSGEVSVYSKKIIVEDVSNPEQEISLEEAQEKNPNYSMGDQVEIEVTPGNFGRIAAQTAKQVVIQRIREAERDIIFEEFANREGDILTGIVQREHKNNIIIDLGKTEAILIPTEQMQSEYYNPGDRIKVYVVEVSQTSKGPNILVSRTHPGLLKRLFELEVPEIHDGVVEIKSVSRESGHRSKIAVYSTQKDVDPVGSCVGPNGSRVRAIVDELSGEKVDIVQWSEDIEKFIANSLSPAEVVKVEANEEANVAKVIVPDYQLSLAIGKEGQNARLAAKLTGWKIDIKSESQLDS